MSVSNDRRPSAAPKILTRLIQSANEKTNSKKGHNVKTNSEDLIHPISMEPVPIIPQPSVLVSEPIQRKSLTGKSNDILPIQLVVNRFLEE